MKKDKWYGTGQPMPRGKVDGDWAGDGERDWDEEPHGHRSSDWVCSGQPMQYKDNHGYPTG